MLLGFENSDWLQAGSNLVSALIGAVVGGAISYVLARQASRETLKRDNEQRIATEMVSFIRTVLKAQQIANSNYTIASAIRQGEQVAKEKGLELWQALTPVSGFSDHHERFDASDLVPLISARRADMIDRLNMAASRHESLAISFADFSRMKVEHSNAYSKFLRSVDAETGFAQIHVPQELFGEFQVSIARLRSLIGELRTSVEFDLAEAGKLCEELGDVGAAYFGEKSAFRLRAHSAEEHENVGGSTASP